MAMSVFPLGGAFGSSREDAAVMVTPPKCVDRRRGVNEPDNLVTIEPERLDMVDVDNGNNKSTFARFFEASFGSPTIESKSSSDRELEEMTGAVKLVLPRETTAAGGFDICREYSYDEDDDECDHQQVESRKQQQNQQPEGQLLMTYVLGRIYHPIQGYNLRRDDESSLFWFTYRCDFPEIVPYNITSDAGWGCMLRSAQMMLGQALRLHYKGRGWRPVHSLVRRRQDPFVRSMLTWFADFPSSTENVYSLHNMVGAGLAKYDKLPGEWYGPGTACYVLRDLVQLHERNQRQQQNAAKPMFRVHVAAQASVYRDSIEDLMTRESRAKFEEARDKKEKESPQEHPLDLAWEEELIESVGGATERSAVEWDTALLLLIPLRLGLKCFNEDYVKAVAHTFSLPQSVGVLGGRPRGARWFYGAVSDGSKILGLDPHTVQNAPRKRTARVNGKAASVVELSDEYMRSVHTTYPEVFSLLKMDPSVALGFYCRSREDLEKVFESLKKWKREHPSSPELFAVADTAPNYNNKKNNVSADDLLADDMLDTNEDDVSDEDEYVML